ncbi:MAG TPA: DciA family protein [Burkholderiales bacterium]|jgi:hypothetical protein|nr:DciA family protein [Burkholderiales bacterium]
MTAHKIGEILTATGQLKALSRGAQRLAELERLLLSAAPRALSEATRIKSFRDGTLVVSADNAAVASKLKLLAPQLLMHIREREPEVTGIRVEVQPAPGAAPRKTAKRALGGTAIAEFQSLAAGLADSPLKSAVERLVQRRGKTGKREQ